jgi:hypothetical protein
MERMTYANNSWLELQIQQALENVFRNYKESADDAVRALVVIPIDSEISLHLAKMITKELDVLANGS